MAKKEKVKVGDKFGSLEVLEKAEDIWSKVKIKDSEGNIRYERGSTHYPAWKCKCNCGEIISVKQSYLLKKDSPYIPSCDKCPKIENPNYIPMGMTEKEKKDWDSLYKYVRKNIMGYDERQSLPSYVVARLKGLCTGNYMVNNNIKKNANYSFETILNTFKFCSPNISKALKTNNFRDENHKVNYVLKIIENNLNDVYVRERNAKKAREIAIEDTSNINLEIYNHEGAKYKPKKKTNKFSHLK